MRKLFLTLLIFLCLQFPVWAVETPICITTSGENVDASYYVPEHTLSGVASFGSIATAEAANDGQNLIISGGTVIPVEIIGDWSGVDDTTSVYWAGNTTGSTGYVIIRCPVTDPSGATQTARNTSGVTNDDYYILRPGSNNGIHLGDDYTIVDGLQVYLEPVAGNNYGFYVRSTGQRVSNSIIWSSDPNQVCTGIYFRELGQVDIDMRAWNDIIFQFYRGVDVLAATGGVSLFNITACKNTLYGVETDNGDTVAKNVLCWENGTNFSGNFANTSDYNWSSDASSPGGGNSITGDTSDPFTDSAVSNYTLANTGVTPYGNGTDVSDETGESIDICNDTRPGTWSMGADDIPSVAGVPSAPTDMIGPVMAPIISHYQEVINNDSIQVTRTCGGNGTDGKKGEDIPERVVWCSQADVQFHDRGRVGRVCGSTP